MIYAIARILRTLRDFNVGISTIICFCHSFLLWIFYAFLFFSSHISNINRVLMFWWKQTIKVFFFSFCVSVMCSQINAVMNELKSTKLANEANAHYLPHLWLQYIYCSSHERCFKKPQHKTRNSTNHLTPRNCNVKVVSFCFGHTWYSLWSLLRFTYDGWLCICVAAFTCH